MISGQMSHRDEMKVVDNQEKPDSPRNKEPTKPLL